MTSASGILVAGLCRALVRRGLRVTPFTAHDMSNNSMVYLDGREIERAQWLQAQSARLEPPTAMNPVLLKPGTDPHSFIVLRGQPAGTLEVGQWRPDTRLATTSSRGMSAPCPTSPCCPPP